MKKTLLILSVFIFSASFASVTATSAVFRPMVFHAILPGTFNMIRAQNPVAITKPFELSQTETTQMQWSMINVLLGKTNPNEINPSYFKTGADSQEIDIDGIKVQMKSDHPVEQVSHDDITSWIKQLNKLSKEGSEQIQEKIQRVIQGHKKGMVYDLPTHAQWVFVMQNRGKNNDKYFDRSDDRELEKYAWYDINASGQTHAVATKQARRIDRGDGVIVDFYDLEGNVAEWNKDWRPRQQLGGNDPETPPHPRGEYGPVINGGAWNFDSPHMCTRGCRMLWFAAYSSGNYGGFRLLRRGP